MVVVAPNYVFFCFTSPLVQYTWLILRCSLVACFFNNRCSKNIMSQNVRGWGLEKEIKIGIQEGIAVIVITTIEVEEMEEEGAETRIVVAPEIMITTGCGWSLLFPHFCASVSILSILPLSWRTQFVFLIIFCL